MANPSSPPVETVSTGADKAKLAVAGVLVVAAVVAFYALGKQDLWLRVVALLVLMILAAVTFFTNYRPQFYFRTTDVTGTVQLPAGTEMVMPGDNISMEVHLIAPIAMDEGLRFAIREGGRTVGAGVVASIIE